MLLLLIHVLLLGRLLVLLLGHHLMLLGYLLLLRNLLLLEWDGSDGRGDCGRDGRFVLPLADAKCTLG